MLVFDAHLDLAWNAIDFNRDLRLPVSAIREAETSRKLSDLKSRGRNTVSFPDLRRGGVGIFIATLLARQVSPALQPAFQRYSNMPAAYASAYAQMAYYRAIEAEGIIRMIRNRAELDAHFEAWKVPSAVPETTPLGFILSMEGADPILHPEQVHEFWDAGLRIIGPAHYGISPYAHGTGTIGGLFPPGKPLLKAMEQVGMILDITHLADQAFDEAMDAYSGPVLASHHNCRSLVPDQRQLSDEQIRRLIERGAVIGAAMDTWMLSPNWVRGESTPESRNVTLATVVDHIDHVCQLAGNTRHAAIGTDLDGGFGREQSPHDLDTIADLQRFPELLRSRGYTDADIQAITHGNWIRFFRDAWSR